MLDSVKSVLKTLDENPIIVPACGHIITVESMDDHMQMKLVLRTISDKGDTKKGSLRRQNS